MQLFKNLVLGVVLLVMLVNLTGCATSSSYMKKEDLLRIYNVTRKEALDAVITSANTLNWKVEDANLETGIVHLHPPLSFWTSSLANVMKGGDIVEVQLVKVKEDMTKVFVEQKSRGEIMDWGRASRNINILFKKLDERIGTPTFGKEKVAEKEIQGMEAKRILNEEELLQAYRKVVKKSIAKHITFPKGAEEGIVYLNVVVLPDGNLKSVEVVEEKSTGDTSLKEAAVQGAKQAVPFSRFPDGVKLPEVEVKFQIAFKPSS